MDAVEQDRVSQFGASYLVSFSYPSFGKHTALIARDGALRLWKVWGPGVRAG